MSSQTFGHYSEDEIKKIVEILESSSVPYEIGMDENISEDIQQSMRNNLRHLHGATICNDLLTIEVNPKDLEGLPREKQNMLKDLRLFWEEPEFSFEQNTQEEVSSTRPQQIINTQEGNRNKVLGLVFLFSIILGGVSWLFSRGF